MCTSLLYTDAAGRPYFGRTLELTVSLPYQVAFFPRGARCVSQVGGHPPVTFERAHDIIAITMPGRLPTAEKPLGPDDLKVIEGLNDAGLTFSVLSYPAAGGRQSVDVTTAVLSASDLGGWILGSFTTVAEVRAALEKQPVALEPLALLGGAVSPFHYVAHDRSGASLVIEFNRGVMKLFDNPVGVMTNGPSFDWHLTNLNNYTFLSNVDRSSAVFGRLQARQPDSGVATAGLPSSSTSVGRFVRAVYYAQFTEKADDPDGAVRALAHIMNNFDRPRGVSIDYPEQGGGGHMEVPGLAEKSGKPYATEFTSWTSLSDLTRTLFFVRDYAGMNFFHIDLAALAGADGPRVIPLAKLAQAAGDVTAALRAAAP
ncbi:linear amide C-N hydrolase [Camelimonas abortus]|uniref:Linear amide C-N hydrolase n=1 Tax=Camelimonas abortus TaxID=1017184 RepID=A0ABV7LBM6_9HYPH